MIRLFFALAKYGLLLLGVVLGGIRMLHGGFWLGLGILAVTSLVTLLVAAIEAWHDAFDRDQNRSQPQG